MAGVLRMQIQETVTTAQSLANRADDLARELEDIRRSWGGELTATWIAKPGLHMRSHGTIGTRTRTS